MEELPPNLARELRARSSAQSSHIALSHHGEDVTYRELWRRVDACGRALLSTGLASGDVIGIIGTSCVDFVVALVATWQIGAVTYPLAGTMATSRRLGTGALSQVQALLIQRQLIHDRPLQGIAQGFTMPSAIADTTFLVYRMPGHRPTEHPVPLDRTAIWIESSGTTGYSKAIKLGTTATLANIRANVDSLGLTSGDRSLAFLPLSYSYGLVGQLLSHLYAGGSVVFPDDPTLVHRIPRAIADGHVTTMFTVPRLLRMLLSVAGMRPGAVPLKSLRLLTVGGEFVDTTTLRMTMDLLKGVDIAVTYGLAEAGPRVSTLRLPAELSHLGSVGKTIGGVQVKIVDDARREVRPGEIGEIVVTSPSVTQGYVGDVRPDGLVPGHLVYTGDLGYITAAGYIYLLGRKHNCLAIGGRIVYANQLKEILYSCDGIVHADVVVDNLSHPADTARVVLSSQPGKALDLASVRRRCETSLSISLDGVIIEQATRNPAVMFRK